MSGATIFQRNKKAYLDEEGKLFNYLSDKSFQTSFQSWLDTAISQLDLQFECCEQQLSELQQSVSVDEGQYWNSRTIIQHCNLHLDDRRLVVKGSELSTHPSWPDVIQLVSAFYQLKSRSFVTPKQQKFLEQCESELQHVVFEPRELRFITNALLTKLQDDSTARSVFSELTKYQNAIDELSPDLAQCETLLEAALMNGEMSLAEEISKKQLDMYEHMLKLISEQYPIIHAHHTEAEENQRRRRWAIFRMANRDISSVLESKFRQMEACEEDLLKIKDQLHNYNSDDVFQRKRYTLDREESDKFLTQNKEKQQSCWNRIYEIFQELQQCQDQLTTLAQQRRREIDRRLQLEEREAGRRSGHDAFIQAAANHAQKLQDTIDNALAARDIAQALNDFVLDGCDSVTTKYDRQQTNLNEMLRLVQHHHFKRFSDYFIAASRLLYRKEKKMETINQQIDASEMQRELYAETLDPKAKKYASEFRALQVAKRDLAEEIVALRHRLEVAERAIAPTLRSFEFNQVPFVHPRDIATKVSVDRATKILDYREVVNPSISTGDRILTEDERQLTMLKSELMEKNSERLKAAARPKAPQHSSASFQRFQNILDKKLELPASSSSQGANAAAVTTSSVGSARSTINENDVVVAVPQAEERAMAAGSSSQQRLDGQSFRALYRYKARAPDELSFERGDVVVCICSALEEGWFRGVCNQRTGLFPINYVAPLDLC